MFVIVGNWKHHKRLAADEIARHFYVGSRDFLFVKWEQYWLLIS